MGFHQLVELFRAAIATLRSNMRANSARSSGAPPEWPDYVTPCLLLLDLLAKPSSVSNRTELEQAQQQIRESAAAAAVATAGATSNRGAGGQARASPDLLSGLGQHEAWRGDREAEAKEEWSSSGAGADVYGGAHAGVEWSSYGEELGEGGAVFDRSVSSSLAGGEPGHILHCLLRSALLNQRRRFQITCGFCTDVMGVVSSTLLSRVESLEFHSRPGYMVCI